MSAVSDHGKKRPNGKKIAELRKEKGLKQESLAYETGISERRLRDIERNDHPIPATEITALADALKVTPGVITLDASPTKAASLLKLRAVRSANELSSFATRADEYEWALEIDPSTETAADMQGVMKTVHRLVRKFGPQPMDSASWDEFDEQQFGEIPRLAHLQHLLTQLGANGVNVVAGTHTRSSLRKLEEGEVLDGFELIVRSPNSTIKQVFKYVTILKIRFVPSEVDEKVIPINPGRSLQDFEIDDDSIPF
jgi:transcriptional regulator with XRE-family HTH domain